MNKSVSLFALARKNVTTNAWMNVKMCFTFACLAFLVCLFLTYNTALNEKRNELIESGASANYVLSKEEIGDGLKESVEIAEHATYDFYSFRDKTLETYGTAIDLTTVLTQAATGGAVYEARTSIAFSAVACGETPIFRDGDYVELLRDYGYHTVFYKGRLPESEEEIALGAPLVRAYKLKADELVGKNIAISMRLPDGSMRSVLSGKVCGIVRSEYYELAGHDSGSYFRPNIFLSEGNPIMKNSDTYHYYLLSEWPEETPMREFMGKFTCTYPGNGLVIGIDTVNGVQELAFNLYVIVGTALGVGLVLTIFLMIDKYVRVFSRTSGILLAFGLEQKKLRLLLLLQLALLCAAAVPLSLVLSVTGYTVINAVIRSVTNVRLGVSFAQIAGMFGIGVAAVLLFAGLFFAYALVRMRNFTVREFLTVEVD